MFALFCSTLCSFWLVLQHLAGEERELAGCFTFVVFLSLFDSSSRCHGLSVVCDCGISWSYSLTF